MILVTSIPPSLSRFDANGCEIGIKYQAACINSWIDAGFEPVSVNAAAERSYARSAVTPVRSVSTSKNACQITGRPQVFFSDLLETAIAESRGNPFVITNADIMFTCMGDLAARVSRLVPGKVLFSRRIDIDLPEQRTGTPWRFGYDVFAVHPDDVSKLTDSGLVFGAPWWDHYFPLAMIERGCRIQQIAEPAVFHLKHKEQWRGDTWQTLGQTFLTKIETCNLPDTYRARLARALYPPTGGWFSELKRRMRRSSAPDWNFELGARLARVSDANLAFLDDISGIRGDSEAASAHKIPQSTPVRHL